MCVHELQGVMTTLMRNGRDRRSENPSGPTRYSSACKVSGTDQRITSGPAATAAASQWRQASRRKQAVYMAAPERFAKCQIPLAPRAPSIHGPERRLLRDSIASGIEGKAEVWGVRSK